MKSRLFLLATALVLFGCAAYKQLTPEPVLQSAEGKYIELKKKDKDFKLGKDKKFFITFPGSQEDNFYLVLSIPEKKKVGQYLTSSLLKKKTPGEKIADETPYPESVSVYPVSSKTPLYYWIIENVPEETVLKMQYRYAPQWRYKFETKHAAYKETLEKHRVDRGPYKSIGAGTNLETVDFSLAIDTVSKHTKQIEAVHKELLAIESIFPQKILNSKDEAYLNYMALKADLEDELKFQVAYRGALEFFYLLAQTRTDPGAFVRKVEEMIAYFSSKAELLPNVLQESQAALKKRVAELPAFYDKKLGEKDDAKPFNPEHFLILPFSRMDALHEAAGVAMDPPFAALYAFMKDYQMKSRALAAIRDSLDAIATAVKTGPALPPDDFFHPIAKRANATVQMAPVPIDQSYGAYAKYFCTTRLNEEINAGSGIVNKQAEQYRTAEGMVPQLNIYRNTGDFRSMLALLLQHQDLGFLLEKYREVDRMHISGQTNRILESMNSNTWRQAEEELTAMFQDNNFIQPAASVPLKDAAVRDLEDSLYTRVERLSRQKINRFLEERVGDIDNVDVLYTDSVFMPAYTIRFSSGGKRGLAEKQNALIADLQRVKENDFPAKAVKLLFDRFVKNPDESGVMMARAIVRHGDYYKGDDKEVKTRIAECNPTAGKWIVKPKEYRRVFALPVTDSKKGKNKYMVRFLINIETEAQFPVYDVNIKLPKEVAQNAAAEQWYETISLNKKELKNEGRFSIGAPTASNDWECQITPVQMNKDKANTLDITFSYPAFKVLSLSVMVQKPIIKKN